MNLRFIDTEFIQTGQNIISQFRQLPFGNLRNPKEIAEKLLLFECNAFPPHLVKCQQYNHAGSDITMHQSLECLYMLAKNCSIRAKFCFLLQWLGICDGNPITPNTLMSTCQKYLRFRWCLIRVHRQ